MIAISFDATVSFPFVVYAINLRFGSERSRTVSNFSSIQIRSVGSFARDQPCDETKGGARLRSRSKRNQRGRKSGLWSGRGRWRENGGGKTHVVPRVNAACNREWAGSSEYSVPWRSKDILHRFGQRPAHLQIRAKFYA